MGTKNVMTLLIITILSLNKAVLCFTQTFNRVQLFSSPLSQGLKQIRRHEGNKEEVRCKFSVVAAEGSGKAIFGMILSTGLGLGLDKIGGHGILWCMLSASMLSNLKFIPKSHLFYDYCWTYFLPMSLTFILFSLPHQKRKRSNATKRLTLPFLFASLGSVVGCVVSYFLNIISPKSEAALAAGCLCASYIGGSFNFWEAGKILTSSSGLNSNQGVLSALAASDIVVMAVYFGLLTVALKSDILKRRFGTIIKSTPSNPAYDSEPLSSSPISALRLLALIVSIVLSFCLVVFSQRLEALTSLAGISSAALCLIAPLTISLVKRVSPQPLSQHISAVSPHLSSFSFHLFFSAIGASINLSSCLLLAPSAFMFASLSLTIHVLILFALSTLLRHNHKKNPSSLFALEEILIASNAAIGGPVTAAAFAANQCRLNQDYIIAATIWGVVGYAFGTTIGVNLFSLLSKL